MNTSILIGACARAFVDLVPARPSRLRRSASLKPCLGLGDHGLDLTTGNAEVHPGDDFFMHVNGGWYGIFEMPGDRSGTASSTCCAKRASSVPLGHRGPRGEKPAVDTPQGKVAAVYNAYMDTDAIEAAGLAPAQPYLDRIDAIDSREALAAAFAQPGFASPFGGYVFVDDKDPDTNIMQMGLSGLGLPDRDYYLGEDDASALREAYVTMLTALFTAAGDASPGEGRHRHGPRDEDRRDALGPHPAPEPRDHLQQGHPDDLLALGGDFPVATFPQEMGLGEEQAFLVSEVPPTAEELAQAQITDEAAKRTGAGFPGTFALANEASLDDWKTWMRCTS